MTEQELLFWLKGVMTQDVHRIDLYYIKKILNAHLVEPTNNYSFTKNAYDHNLLDIPQISFDDR